MTPSELARATVETAPAQKTTPVKTVCDGGGAKKTVVRQISPEWELDPVTGKKFYPLPIFGTFTGEENAYSPAAAQPTQSESQLMTPSRLDAVADSAAKQRQAIASHFTGEENAVTPEGLKTPLSAFSTQSQGSGTQPPMTPSRLSAMTLDTGTTQSTQTPYLFTSGEEFPVAGVQTAQVALDSLDHIGNLLYDNDKRDYLLKSLKQVAFGNYTDDVTLLGAAGQIGLGLANLDLPSDIRDLMYDLTNWESTPEHMWQTALDLVGFLPLIGSLKYADEVGTALNSADEVGTLIKDADNVAQGLGDVGKYWDEAAEGTQAAVKSGELDNIQRAINEFWDHNGR